MAMRQCRYLKRLEPMLYGEFGREKADAVINRAWEMHARICAENAEEPKAVRMHTRDRIYPAVAAFLAMLDHETDRERAGRILYEYYEQQSKPAGAFIRAVLRIPGLYRLVPRFFSKMTRCFFGEAAGFRAKWIRAGKNEMRFDMVECPYQDICVRYGCPEIVRSFCRADDICYGDMHPRLYWGRTKTLGYGDDCCDFRLTIRGRG